MKIYVKIFVIALGVLSVSSIANAQVSGVINSFDINPKTVNLPPDPRTVNVTFRVSINLNNLLAQCGANTRNFWWYIYEDLTTDLVIRSGSLALDLNSPTSNYNLDQSLSLPSSGGNSHNYYGSIYCPNLTGNLGGLISRSSNVTVSESNAQQPPPPPPPGGGPASNSSGQTTTVNFQIPNPLGGNITTLTNLIDVIATWIFNISIPIVVIMIIYSGIIFLTSQGNPGKVQQAKGILWYALVGLAIVLIGRGFVELVNSILNLS